ncbi:MAG: two-component sensor histidine kinase [Flavobacteriales bacterium]|jgi:two-component sensor histidine kinase
MIQQYKKALELAQIALWNWEVATNVTCWFDEKFQLFGYEPNEFEVTMENAFKTVHPDDVQAIFKTLEENLPINDFFEYEYRGIKKDKSIINVWVRVNVERNEKGEPFKVHGISQNITQRKNLENKIHLLNENLESTVVKRTKLLEKKNDENVLLVKEMHHRVKNNLQIISSILNLQQRFVKDETAKKILSESTKRIKSIALIHDSLYKQDNLIGIDVKKYIENLFSLHFSEDDNIKTNIICSNFQLPINKMVPLGIILNELISNSIKHGFSYDQSANDQKVNGEISISLSNENEFKLQYSDNGKGFDPDEINKSGSFGLDLIDTLTEDLEAQIKYESAPEEGMTFYFNY